LEETTGTPSLIFSLKTPGAACAAPKGKRRKKKKM
jgi:hypothetical protein